MTGVKALSHITQTFAKSPFCAVGHCKVNVKKRRGKGESLPHFSSSASILALWRQMDQVMNVWDWRRHVNLQATSFDCALSKSNSLLWPRPFITVQLVNSTCAHVTSGQREICDVQKPLGMRKMVATFYCHFAIPVLKQEWWQGESGDNRM